jgi:hypothetical protein
MLPNRSSKVAKKAFPRMSRAAIVKKTKSWAKPGIVMLEAVFEVPRTGMKFARTVKLLTSRTAQGRTALKGVFFGLNVNSEASTRDQVGVQVADGGPDELGAELTFVGTRD